MMKDLAQVAQLMRGRNTQERVMQMIKNSNTVDPTITQLIQFAQTGDTNSLVNLATSMFAQQGLDFNKELQDFMSMMK